jgi:hypothetical protein
MCDLYGPAHQQGHLERAVWLSPGLVYPQLDGLCDPQRLIIDQDGDVVPSQEPIDREPEAVQSNLTLLAHLVPVL